MKSLWLAVTLLAALNAPVATACSCVFRSNEQSLKSADVVFVGRLAAVKFEPSHQAPQSTSGTEHASFVVERVIKGQISTKQSLAIKTEIWPGGCGMSVRNNPTLSNFEAEKNEPIKVDFNPVWLIYASGEEPSSISMCSGSSPIEVRSNEDIHQVEHRSPAE